MEMVGLITGNQAARGVQRPLVVANQDDVVGVFHGLDTWSDISAKLSLHIAWQYFVDVVHQRRHVEVGEVAAVVAAYGQALAAVDEQVDEPEQLAVFDDAAD